MTFNPFSLEGKRVLVTGASSGIGRQIAISCAEMGAQVVLTGRDSGRLNEALALLEGSGHSAICADLQASDDIARIAATVPELNGVVHAAGIAKLVPFRMLNEKHLREIFSINLESPLLLTRALLVKKLLAPGGSLVFIGSVGASIGPVATTAYSASKAAMSGAVRSLAQEVAKLKIRANLIEPGYVRTPLLDKLGNSGGEMGELLELAPLGLGEPEDVAYAAVFYLSDASRWMTRTRFVIDGGLTVPMSV